MCVETSSSVQKMRRQNLLTFTGRNTRTYSSQSSKGSESEGKKGGAIEEHGDHGCQEVDCIKVRTGSCPRLSSQLRGCVGESDATDSPAGRVVRTQLLNCLGMDSGLS